jgi:hypothetical protein
MQYDACKKGFMAQFSNAVLIVKEAKGPGSLLLFVTL